MTPLSQAPTVILSFVRKIFNYENGALIILATPVSEFLIKVLKEIFVGVATKDYALPFLVAAVCIMLYFFVYAMDFITGLRASRFESNNKADYIKSEKLWSSIWKISVIFLIVFCLTIFALVFAILGLGFFHSVFMYSTAVVSIMAILFDLHSIGENHKRRFGKKPKLFDWLDQMTKAINDGFLKKVNNLFN